MAAIGRRGLLKSGLAAGAGFALGGPAPAASDPALVAACDRFVGLDFTAREAEQAAPTIDEALDRLRLLRAVELENALGPAERFDPRLPGWRPLPAGRRAPAPKLPPPPASGDDIAFAPAWMQAGWIARGKLTSRALVDLYLNRITRLARPLEAFALIPAEQARAEADARDREHAAGHSCGPLHGLPYGLKDLIDTAGLETAWGAEPYRGRVPARDATVVERLRAAGAVLLAKTSCGAIAYGDIWYGGRTRNPWNPAEGSSGSSAGSASSVAAGLASFAIGTETMGSIVSPAARCGTVGLRPTFGRVPRGGAMALAWSYDKIGVLARDPLDTALVLAAMAGAGADDVDSRDVSLGPVPRIDLHAIRLGYRREWFAGAGPVEQAALEAARVAGFALIEVDMPATDTRLLRALVTVEAAAAFEPLTLDGRDDSLAWQAPAAWPNSWRAARFEPAIGHVQARRLRRRLMGEFAATMTGVDALIHPNGAGQLTAIGNHCGYPALSLPAGLTPQATRGDGADGWRAPVAGDAATPVPFPIVLTGQLYDEPRLIAIGRALAAHLPAMKRPPGF